mgnify:FL=1
MASLATLFRIETNGAQESDKLVDLFRNRVELKKEFAALRNEKYMLQDRIKQHRGATARVEQRLQHLENLLLDPEWVHNVTAFYQLRSLAKQCTDQLSRFAEQLKQQSEQRAHSRTLESWNERRQRKLDSVKNQIGEQRLGVQSLEDQLQAERHRLMTMNGFIRLFRGRKIARQIDEIAAQIETGQQRESELLQDLERIQRLDPPDSQGLEVAAKRSINFMILSFAQQLYLDFEEYDLVGLSKEANEKSIGAINYGGKPECDAILKMIATSKTAAEQMTDLADVLQQRARLIGEEAVFRHDDNAVPVPASVATVYVLDDGGAVERKTANLLGDNYFGIAKVLSR